MNVDTACQMEAMVPDLSDSLISTANFGPEPLCWVDTPHIEVVVGDQRLERLDRSP